MCLEPFSFFTMLDKLPKLLVTQFAKCPEREKETTPLLLHGHANADYLPLREKSWLLQLSRS